MGVHPLEAVLSLGILLRLGSTAADQKPDSLIEVLRHRTAAKDFLNCCSYMQYAGKQYADYVDWETEEQWEVSPQNQHDLAYPLHES